MSYRPARDVRGKRILAGTVAQVTLTSGVGTMTITFPEAFPTPPSVMVVPHEGDVLCGASYNANSITRTNFEIEVADSSYPDGVIDVAWVAVEKS